MNSELRSVDAELVAVRNALRDSDARFTTLADALPHMVWSTLPDGFHDYYNARWYEFTGVALGTTDGEGWNGMFHPEDQERAWATWRRSLATGEPYEIEYRLRHHSGEYRWTLGRALPMRGDDGRIIRWIGTCTDIHDSKRQADRVEVLSRELSHRIKNIFAVISGLVGLSGRRHPSAVGLVRELQARISALGRAHEFVRPNGDSSGRGIGAETLHGILRQILSPYPALDEGRITIEGADVRVDDRGATPIALLIHELATNACKYGALSRPEGKVAIVSDAEGEELEIIWRESGGPAIGSPPSSAGFGTMLSDLSVRDQLGGTIERLWQADGLEVVVRVPRYGLSRAARASAEQS